MPWARKTGTGRQWLFLLVTLLVVLSMPARVAVANPAATAASPNCCASAWYPWGWYETEPKCRQMGAELQRTIPVVLAYKCTYSSWPPDPNRPWRLSVLEVT